MPLIQIPYGDITSKKMQMNWITECAWTKSCQNAPVCYEQQLCALSILQ